MADTSYTHMFKIVLLGDSGVGKSQMLQRFTKGKFSSTYSTTVGAEFATKDIKLKNGVSVKVQIWDTAGQEKFRTITRAFYRGAVGALLVYDVTKLETFDSCEKWMSEIKKNTPENQVAILLVGNKTDLVPTFMHSQNAIDFAQKNNLALYSSSALTGDNIDMVFQTLVEEIYSQIEKNQQSGVVPQKESSSNNKPQELQQQQKEKQQLGTNDNKQLNQGQHQGSILTHPSTSKKNKKQESDCSC